MHGTKKPLTYWFKAMWWFTSRKSGVNAINLMDLLGIDAKSLSESFRLMICVGNLLAVLSTEELSEGTKREIASSTKIALAYTDPEFLTMMGDIYDLRSEVERFMGQVR